MQRFLFRCTKHLIEQRIKLHCFLGIQLHTACNAPGDRNRRITITAHKADTLPPFWEISYFPPQVSTQKLFTPHLGQRSFLVFGV